MGLLKTGIVLSVVFTFISCAGIISEETISSGSGKDGLFKGTLAVYFYQPDVNPQDINFTIEWLKIKRKNGEWIELLSTPLAIKSLGIAGEQIFLSESSIQEGEYEGLKMRVSKASVRRDEKYYTLALSQSEGEVDIACDILTIKEGGGEALFLIWDADKSVSDNYLFNPSIKVELQEISTKTLLLYVANSGSNYISVIDRFENRVVGIIGVERNPTAMVLSEEQERLYVMNSSSNSISVIDTSQDYVRDKIQFVSGIEPVEMVMVPYSDKRNHGKLYITNRGSNDVTVVDTFMKSQIKNIRVGNSPLGISANILRQEIYVANSGSNSISVIDSLTDTVKTTITVDKMPVDVVATKSFLYVINKGSDNITVIDTVTKTVKNKIPAGAAPRKGLYSEKYNRIYITNHDNGEISFLIPAAAVITRSVKVGYKPLGLAIDEGRNRLYITDYGSNAVTVVNPTSEIIEKKITVGKKPYGIVSVK